jgi:hypothetical protein
VYWSSPDWKAKMKATARSHAMDESPFIETLVLAWFDPLHFSRMLRWLYPNGHPAFHAPTPESSGAAALDLRDEVEDLQRELEVTRSERDAALGKVTILEGQLQAALAAERAARDKLEAWHTAHVESVESSLERAEEFTGVPLAVVSVVEKVLRDRHANREGSKRIEPDVSDSLIVEEMRKAGYGKPQTFAQLRLAVATGQLKQNGSKYLLPLTPDYSARRARA